MSASKACTVYHPAAVKGSPGSGNTVISVSVPGNIRYLTAEMILSPVRMGIFCQGNGIAKGIYNPAVL